MNPNYDKPTPPPPSERLPPHSIEAEQGVLGSVLLQATEGMRACLDRGLRVAQALPQGDGVDGLGRIEQARQGAPDKLMAQVVEPCRRARFQNSQTD